MLRRIRAIAYKRGYRPKPGTLLYSPSLSLIYGWRDSGGLLSQQHPAFIEVTDYEGHDFTKIKGVDFDGDTVLKFGPDQMVSQHPDISELEKIYKSATYGIQQASEIIKTNLTPAFNAFWNTALMDPEVRLAYWEAYVQDEESSNPWPVGTDAWHEWNLHGKSCGHFETHIKGPRGEEWVGVMYGPTSFVWSRQKAGKDVSTLLSESWNHPPELWAIESWLPKELLEADVATDA